MHLGVKPNRWGTEPIQLPAKLMLSKISPSHRWWKKKKNQFDLLFKCASDCPNNYYYHLQNQKSCTGPLVAAIIAISIWSFTTYSAQQSAHDTHQHQQQSRTNGKQYVVHVNVIFFNIGIGRIEMLFCSASRIRDACQCPLYFRWNISHGLTSVEYGVFHLWNVMTNRLIDVNPQIFQSMLTASNRIDGFFGAQLMHTGYQFSYIRQLNEIFFQKNITNVSIETSAYTANSEKRKSTNKKK